jgi:diguanylate cyclase (GGDEF)-like protein
VGPLVGAVLLWLAYTSAASATAASSPGLIRAAGTAALAAIATVALPWERLPASLMAVPPLLYLLVASTLRMNVGAGGASAVPTGVLLLPIFWLALYATEAELAIGLVALGAAALSGSLAQARTPAAWQGAVMLTVLGAAVALAVHALFEALRTRTANLERLVRTDPLTGVPNRRAWDEALAGLGRGRDASVIVLDLDRFKDYNDDFGHQAGDRLLKAVAAAWSVELRQEDLLARLGGDEFAVVLPGCAFPAAFEVAERLRAVVPDRVTSSAGVACWDGVEPATELVGRADRALYHAKRAGRDRVVVDGADLTVDR